MVQFYFGGYRGAVLDQAGKDALGAVWAQVGRDEERDDE